MLSMARDDGNRGCIRYGFGTFGTDMDVNLTRCPVQLSIQVSATGIEFYRYRRYRCPRRTELTEMSGTPIDFVIFSRY